MKEGNEATLNETLPDTCIYTCITRCEKGIYQPYQMKLRRVINYQMPTVGGNTAQNITSSNKEVRGRCI